jgi:thioredoxin 1
MSVAELGQDNFGQVLGKRGLALVDCWASWCGGCGAFETVFEQAAEKYPEHRFLKLNTQEQKEITSALEITHIPALLVYRDGLLLLRHPGSLDREQLANIVTQAQALDMDRVRSEIERERQDGSESS